MQVMEQAKLRKGTLDLYGLLVTDATVDGSGIGSFESVKKKF